VQNSLQLGASCATILRNAKPFSGDVSAKVLAFHVGCQHEPTKMVISPSNMVGKLYQNGGIIGMQWVRLGIKHGWGAVGVVSTNITMVYHGNDSHKPGYCALTTVANYIQFPTAPCMGITWLSFGQVFNHTLINMWWHLPSGYVKIAIENTPFIVDLPIQNGDFP